MEKSEDSESCKSFSNDQENDFDLINEKNNFVTSNNYLYEKDFSSEIMKNREVSNSNILRSNPNESSTESKLIYLPINTKLYHKENHNSTIKNSNFDSKHKKEKVYKDKSQQNKPFNLNKALNLIISQSNLIKDVKYIVNIYDKVTTFNEFVFITSKGYISKGNIINSNYRLSIYKSSNDSDSNITNLIKVTEIKFYYSKTYKHLIVKANNTDQDNNKIKELYLFMKNQDNLSKKIDKIVNYLKNCLLEMICFDNPSNIFNIFDEDLKFIALGSTIIVLYTINNKKRNSSKNLFSIIHELENESSSSGPTSNRISNKDSSPSIIADELKPPSDNDEINNTVYLNIFTITLCSKSKTSIKHKGNYYNIIHKTIPLEISFKISFGKNADIAISDDSISNEHFDLIFEKNNQIKIELIKESANKILWVSSKILNVNNLRTIKLNNYKVEIQAYNV